MALKQRSIRSMISMILSAAVLGMAMPVGVQGAETKETAEEAVVEDEKNLEEEKDSTAGKDTDKEAEKQADEEEKEDSAKSDEANTDAEDDAAVTVPVPIYNYDIANVVLPTSYSVALNPYELPVKTKNGTVSSAQVVSQNYGIVNKSTRDKVVTATFTIEDENAGKIVFVESKEEALNADKDTYAVYLSVVPADDTGVKVDGENADEDTSSEALSDVAMNKAGDHAVVLSEGESQISFLLSRAVYEFGDSAEIILDSKEDADQMPKLAGLAENSGGVTAFTFDGVMNPKADWAKITKGVRISVMYDYGNATGDEKIVDGTSAMIVK